MNKKSLTLIGYGSGLAAGDPGCGDGPIALQKSNLLHELQKHDIAAHWEQILVPDGEGSVLQQVTKLCTDLGRLTALCIKQHKMFTVFGGDHSCAIGTWSGVAHARAKQGPIGLIWVDAHMDCHTPETSESGNIHGMPVASLLGYGVSSLAQLGHWRPKLKPENICLIGIRSFEPGEAALVKKLGIRVFDMEEIGKRGIEAVLQDAIAHVNKNTNGYGFSLDLDGFDPQDAPGTGTPESGGISASQFCAALKKLIVNDTRILGAEIVEFNPHHDIQHRTRDLIQQLLIDLFSGQ
jgi:arginase